MSMEHDVQTNNTKTNPSKISGILTVYNDKKKC